MTRLASFLQIRPGEAKLVALVSSLFALIEAGRGLGGNAADALFYLRFGVDYLPYMFMLLGAVNFFVSLTYAAGLGRFDKRRFFVTLLIVLAIVLLIERTAILLDVAALYPVLWITINIISSLVGLLSWNIAGDVCDARQAKRLFSLFVSAGILGGVIGNFITGPIAQALGTENLFILYAVLLFVATLITRRIMQQFFKPVIKRGPATRFIAEVRAGFDFVRASSLFKTLALASVLFSISYFSLSFPFSKAVSAAMPNEADMAGFLGVFSGITTAMTFVVSLFIANRLYARIGVVNAVLLLPIAYLIGFILFALNFSLTSAVIARMAQLVVLGGIASAAYGTFFNVVPPDKRGQVRSFDSGVPEPIGVALSGVLLILGERVMTPTQIFIMGMIVASLCGVLIWRLRRSYGDALIAALRAGRFEVFTAGGRAFATVQGDANALKVVTTALRDPKSSARRLAVDMLARMNATAATSDIVPLLRDADAEVRVAALRALGDLHAHDAAGALALALNDADATVRAAALRVLPDLSPPITRPLITTIEDLLQDADLTVQLQAAVTLAKLHQADRALPILDRRLHDPEPHTRALALDALSGINTGFDLAPIIMASHDAAPIVRRAACRALAQIQSDLAIDALIERVSDADPGVRAAAAFALRGRGSNATSRVLNVLHADHEIAHAAALEALTPGDPDLPGPLHAYAQREIEQLQSKRELIAGMPAAGRVTKLLRETLETRCASSEQRLIKTIGLIGNREAMELIGKGLHAREAEARAEAIEALDTLADRQLAKQIIPLLEDTPANARTGAAATIIKPLLSSEDTWLRALAARAAGELNARDLIAELRTLAAGSDSITGAAAHEALIQLQEVEPMDTLPTMSLIERVLLLHEVPMFAQLSPDDLKQIADIAREQWHSDGALICREGDEGHELFVLASGQVRVTKGTGEAEKFLAMRSAGEFIGEMAIVEATPRSATVRAHGEVRTLVIDGEMFKTILRDRPEVSLAVLRGVMRRMREKE